MIFKRSWPDKVRRNQEWHRWFAWHPVITEDGKNRVWLSYVERRWGIYPPMFNIISEYRLIKKAKESKE